MKDTRFEFERGRGVVWVCDIQSSSKHLNENESADAVEEFFPRLHWMERMAVDAAGGRFLKWTGDGFLAWFPVRLNREIGSQSTKIFDICQRLSLINNVTGLGINSGIKFRLRHGVTVEHDALLTVVSDKNGGHLDIVGRSVVLAFRLAGINVSFPNIFTQQVIVNKIREDGISLAKFKRYVVSFKDRQTYFKSERWGTNGLCSSTNQKPRARSLKSLSTLIGRTISNAEERHLTHEHINPAPLKFIESLLSGPEWTRDVLQDYDKFLEEEDLLGTLKVVARELESALGKQGNSESNRH